MQTKPIALEKPPHLQAQVIDPPLGKGVRASRYWSNIRRRAENMSGVATLTICN